MVKQMFILMCLTFIHFIVYADNQDVLSQAFVLSSNQTVLERQITVDRKFVNINAVANKLNTLGIKSLVKSCNQDEIHNALIVSDGTINDFINLAAQKFNYFVVIDASSVIFEAKNPLKVKPVASLITAIVKTKPTIIAQQTWTLSPKDKMLRNSLTKWSKLAGWQLIWNVKADYPITTLWTISGTFESAVNEVLKASQNTDVPLMATMHDNNHVLEIFSTTTVK